MCGICGYTKFNHSIEGNIEEMLEEIKHRGPDFNSKSSEKLISLAHSRLSIIDLSEKANQPFVLNNGQYSLVYNGEIYNFKKIKRKLETKFGVEFKTSSDTEVILHGYIHLKNKIFNELDGMFALAIWDRENKKLTLARDIFGEKPLFYFKSRNDIFFASDIKSLSKAPMFDNKISNQSLKSFLNYNYVNSKNRTIYENIFKVEPGTYLEFDQNGLRKQSFFSFRNLFKNNNNNKDLFQLDKILQNSVNSRMISDTEGGIFLSGGLDSSLIAYYASKFQSNLKCFTLGFKENSYDETDKARYVSKKLNLKHYVHYLDETDLKNINKVILSVKEPFADTAIISNYFLSKFSKKYVKFCLGGDGADEIFSGYDTYDATYIYNNLKKNKFYDSLFKLISKFTKYLPQSKSKVNNLYKIKKFLDIYQTGTANPHLLWRQVHNESEIKEILDEEYYENIFKNTSNELEFENNNTINDLNYLNLLDIENFLIEDVMLKTDRTSMANGLEVRSPFLNLEVIRNVFNIKESQRYRLFNKKVLFKELLINKFDKKFIHQKKRGFNAPVSLWLKNQLHDNFIDNIQNDKTGIFDKKAIMKLHNKHIKTGHDYGNRLFNIMCLVTWVNSNKASYE